MSKSKSKKQPVSEKKRLANQRNAQKSTGPKTPEGKARSSKNAILHGIFCQEVVILKEDLPLFTEMRREFIQDLRPQRLIELAQVDKIAECYWKMRRLRVSESTENDLELREHLKHQGQTWEEEMARNDQPDYCAPLAMSRMIERDCGSVEHYSRIEQRLQNMVHRCLKELRTLQETAAKTNALPPSPFEATVENVDYKWATGWEEEEQEEEKKVDEKKVDEGESAERSQLDSDASPSPRPSPTGREGEAEMRNEANEG